MAARVEARLVAPLVAGAWAGLGRWRWGASGEGEQAGAWAAKLPEYWAARGIPAALDHGDALSASAARLVDAAPEGGEVYARPSADGSELSIVTVTLVALAEPAAAGAPRRERTASGWVLRGRRRGFEIHAALSGAPATVEELEPLFAKLDVEVEKKGGFGQAVKEVGDFLSFWSFGGRA